ncbi:NAC transcription factor 29-like isoform X1 [Prunus dulcis]|uniref:NAC transcription factor 29-like isoform X1 n=1 Tax=Prunus dulcis TaxID=3755 RepID=UPI00148224E6|nr:NAC transcription factor 29-like isoform X1 [Prunus dulcis]XP_034198967.1 NAC transcription factor 29-like isoform X1 [Prunus dulcis]XP_034198968.1 NAC transcription factor 29-like isoform X1 [Prunus dulcis]
MPYSSSFIEQSFSHNSPTQTQTKAQVIIVLLFMALPSPQSTSQVPETEKDFDLLKCSKIENGKKEAEIHLVGYRFDPSEDQIVVFYLFNKILGRELPINDIIKEISVYEHDPDELPNDDFKHGVDCNEAFYFAYTEQVYSSRGKITRRTTKSGYWDLDGEEEEVRYRNGDITVGFEKVMVFHKGTAPNGIETDFSMHEYRVNPLIVPTHVLNDSIRAKIERYVVCRIIHEGVSNFPLTNFHQDGLLGLLKKQNQIDMTEIA